MRSNLFRFPSFLPLSLPAGQVFSFFVSVFGLIAVLMVLLFIMWRLKIKKQSSKIHILTAFMILYQTN